MAKKKPDPYATSAANQATVQFGPQETVLAQLLRDAEARRDTALRQAKSGRQYTVGSVNQAVPQVNQAYETAGAAVTPAFAAGGGVEAAALKARMAEAQAQAQTQLSARRVGAVEGEQAARVQAQRDYSTDRGKVFASATDLERERGAFTSQTISDLRAADAKAQADAQSESNRLGQQERDSIRSAGFDPDQPLQGGGYAPLPGGKADPKAKGNNGSGWASQAAQTKASDQISGARNEAKTLKDGGFSRADTAALLLHGAPASERPIYRSVKDPRTGRVTQERVLNPDGTQKTQSIRATPKVDSQLLLSAALDMEYDGHLSARNEKLLHARGIQLAPLGLVTLGEYRKKVRQPISRPGTAPAYGGSRPT